MRFRRALIALILMGLSLTAFMYWTATRDPVVRTAEYIAPGWNADASPQTIVMLSDIHVAGPDMPPERLAQIVAQINALEPDLVLFAGDFVSDKAIATHIYPASEALAPLAALKARLGVVAVMGNHDHWRDEDYPNDMRVTDALRRYGVRVLDNDVARYGRFIIGGVDDDYTGHADLPKTLTAMQAIAASSDSGKLPLSLLLSHSPDIFPAIPASVRPGDTALVFAGHTHCGQIVLPMIGPLTTLSKYGTRYACGRIDKDGKTLFVGAGIGTSILPLRLGAVPDMWLITVRGDRGKR